MSWVYKYMMNTKNVWECTDCGRIEIIDYRACTSPQPCQSIKCTDFDPGDGSHKIPLFNLVTKGKRAVSLG
jgi:hypothetical protein